MFRPPKVNVTKKLSKVTETCSYKVRNCSQPRLDNYEYCFRHILEDKTAPFRQCGYIAATGRRCINPTPKTDRRDNSYCSEHVRKAQLRHQKQSGRPQPPRTAESLLSSLAHFVKPIKASSNQGLKGNESELGDSSHERQELLSSDTIEKEQILITKSLNPFVDIDANSVNNSLNHVLDYCSESDSDVDVTTVDDTNRIKDEDSSDAESIDSSHEDVFKHAGVLTSEEVILRAKEKLIRLQSLYIDQFKRLQHILRERRRDYLQLLQKEKETMCSIANQPRTTIKEQRIYKKLKYLKHYHKRYGVEAVLQKKALDRRTLVTEGIPQKPSSTSKCIYTEGGVKCSLKTLPCAKYCNKHILEDPNQMLFRKCGANKSDSICQEPVLHVFNNDNCVYHYNIPSVQLSYNTSISSDEEESKEVTKKKVKRMQRNSFSKKIKTEDKFNECTVTHLKSEVKKEALSPIPSSSEPNLDEKLRKSALYTVEEKGEESKITNILTEELPLQIMECKEFGQEECHYETAQGTLQNEGTVIGQTLYMMDDEL